MKNSLIGWLSAKGINLPENATDQTVLVAMQRAFTDAAAPVKTLANERESLSGQITHLTNERDTFKGQVTVLTNERDGLKTKFDAERKLRAENVVDLAISRGKLTVAKRAERVTSLCNSSDFEKDAADLIDPAKANVIKLPADARSGKRDATGIGNDMDQNAVRQTYCDAVKKHMRDNEEDDPIKAHKAVMAAHPELADALKPKAP